MTIALVGPQKYDFQDLCCIQFILKFYKKNKINFCVEPQGGEDARLVFEDENSQSLLFEIQIKGSEEQVNFEKVAECLGHFPANKDSNFLFERFVKNTSSRCILVMSGRAEDALQKCIPKGNWDGQVHETACFTQQNAQKILDALKNYANKLTSTPQKERRKSHIHAYISSVSLNDVKNSLSRLIIIDNTRADILSEQCRIILRRDFNIPDDMFNEIMADLTSVIKEGKLSQQDVVPVFLNKLNSRSIVSIQPRNYVKRGQEDHWINLLTKKNVLLLSGKPRVGKTNTAKWIGAQFQKQGYSVTLMSDVYEAERYLLDPVNTPRLVVLDDPLGGSHSVEKPHEKITSLKKLITNLRGNRKLIIAQGQERLLEVAEVEIIADASLNANPWIDFSELSSEFLLDLWKSLREIHSISEPIFSTMSLALEKNGLLIEPGCLVYLAVENQKIHKYVDINKIIKFARKDAQDLGLALKSEGCKDVLIGLATVTSHLNRVEKETLAFVLSNTTPKAYGYSSFKGTLSTLGKKTVTYEFPTYSDAPQLTKNDCESLELLELRRLIDFDNLNQTKFTHPFYRSAAESLINFPTQNSFYEIKRILTNGIFCLSPITARASARNIQWIYEKAKNDKDKDSIVEIAISGLDSSYPSVRDICFEFLIDNFLNLSTQYSKDRTKWIKKVSYEGFYDGLQWRHSDGEPWYPMGESITLEVNGICYQTFDKKCATKLINKINNDIVAISTKDANNLLSYLEQNPEELTQIIISRILSSNEGIIRALAAKVWVKINRNDDKQILDRIFSDRHPAVAKSVFESAISSWTQFGDERKDYFFKNLKELANQPVLASAIIDRLVVFERSHITGENPPWNLFATLLPKALSAQLPSDDLNYARLYNVVEHAINLLELDLIIPIFDSWISLLERIAINQIPDDYALGFTSILMESTKSNSNKRGDYVTRLLSLHGTGSIVRVISDLIDYWDDLENGEKKLVATLISSDRSDKIWLKAAVLTSIKAPLELLPLVIDEYSSAELKKDDILNLEPSLLAASLKIYVGEPQPLWWIATHHREKNVWPKIIDAIARKHSHPLFKLAFNALLNSYKQEQLCSVIREIGVDGAQTIFELILQQFIFTNPESMPKVWQTLFDIAPNESMRKEWVKCIASNALYILDSWEDAKKLIPNGYLNEFYAYLQNDIRLLYFSSKLLKDAEELFVLPVSKEILDPLFPKIKDIFENHMPTHHDTCDILMNRLKYFGYSQEQVSFMQEKREELLENKHNKHNRSNKEELTFWIF